ncbi:hypothetical protein [Cucumibacter marinus]|uniref:hypothetical protein n=1 Tax=Cucumibacter marinus TaxID=1121252 RepID=UPI00048EE2BC|nr:hypothetical protein [Cucumibacter marinus]
MTFSLRSVLYLDAACCVLIGAVLFGWAAPLESILGLPAPLIFWAGLLLFPSAAMMLIAARSERPHPALVLLIVFGNVAWVVASVILAAGVPFALTPLGRTFLLVQAAAVAVLAWQEWALRSTRGLA